jgi:hypothetical protein
MIDERKFELVRGARKGKSLDAARLVMCFGVNQIVAAESMNISQQAVSSATKAIGKRISKLEKAFSKLSEGIDVTHDLKGAENAFLTALEVVLK